MGLRDGCWRRRSFFDNEQWNCTEVTQLGVKCVYCPHGMDEPSWEKGVKLFAGSSNMAYPR